MLGKFNRLFKGWVRKKDGTTAVEFSLLCIPYFMLTIGIIEISIMFTAASLLEGATSVASRMLRTGQIQQATADAGEQQDLFLGALCGHAAVLIVCDDVQLEVMNIGQFGDFGDFGAQYDGDGNLNSQGFNPGGSSEVVLIRVAYRYNMMTPFIGNLLGENGTTSRFFMSTIILQVEPYEFEDDDRRA